MSKVQGQGAHKRSESNATQALQGNPFISKEDNGSKVEQSRDEWNLKREKILFAYALVLIFLGFVLCTVVILFNFPPLVLLGAAATLWGIITGFKKHVLATPRVYLTSPNERLRLESRYQSHKGSDQC